MLTSDGRVENECRSNAQRRMSKRRYKQFQSRQQAIFIHIYRVTVAVNSEKFEIGTLSNEIAKWSGAVGSNVDNIVSIIQNER